MVASFSHYAAHSTIHEYTAGSGSAFRSTMNHTDGRHFVMWIDAVGGYLVCRGDHIHLGQAIPGNRVDVPIRADISRRHASIRRDEDGYLLLPSASVSLDGKSVTQPTPLCDGQEIDLAGAAKLEFRIPHPLSRTARLTITSRHRTQPPVDGILLLAESCIIGPAPSCHVWARDMAAEAVLFEQEDELQFRTAGKIVIDDTEHEKQGRITDRSRISGEDFSLSLESL